MAESLITETMTFTVRGGGVKPETIRLSDLIDLLSEFDSAVRATVADNDGSTGNAHLSLVRVGEGSGVFGLCADQKSLAASARITAAIVADDIGSLPKIAQQSLREIWNKIRIRNWSIGILHDKASGEICLSSDSNLSWPVFVRGRTTICGHLHKIGGPSNDAKAAIKLFDGTKISARVSRDMAEELGHRLYKVIALHGEGEWNAATHKLVSFKADGIEPYDHDAGADAIAGFKELAAIGGNPWENIDPDQYAREVRSEDVL